MSQLAPTPLLLMHGTADELVPVEHSRLLFERAGEPRELWLVEGAAHSSLLDHDPQAYQARVLQFLARWLGPPRPGAGRTPPISGVGR